MIGEITVPILGSYVLQVSDPLSFAPMILRLQNTKKLDDYITCHMRTTPEYSTTPWKYFFDHFSSNDIFHDDSTLLSVFFRVLTYYMASKLGRGCHDQKAHFVLFAHHANPSKSDLLVTSGLNIEDENDDSWFKYTRSFPLDEGDSWFTSLPLLDNMNESIIFSSIESTPPTPVS